MGTHRAGKRLLIGWYEAGRREHLELVEGATGTGRSVLLRLEITCYHCC